MIAWCMYYYMPLSDTLRAPQHNSNTCSTFFAFQYLDIRVKYGTWNTHPTNQLQVHLNIPLHATLTTLSYDRDMTFKCEHTICQRCRLHTCIRYWFEPTKLSLSLSLSPYYLSPNEHFQIQDQTVYRLWPLTRRTRRTIPLKYFAQTCYLFAFNNFH